MSMSGGRIPVLADGGRLVVSGVRMSSREAGADAFAKRGLYVAEEMRDGEWCGFELGAR